MGPVTFGRHFTRIASVFVMAIMLALVVWVTIRMFGVNPPNIGMGAATAYGSLMGTGLAAAWGIYKYARRGKDDA